MKKKTTARKAPVRESFNEKLTAYSNMSAAAAAVAAAGLPLVANGQIINLTASSLNQTPTWSVTTLGHTNSGFTQSAHQIQLLPFVSGANVAHGQWRIKQYNNYRTNGYSTITGKSARGEIQLFGSGTNPRLFFAGVQTHGYTFAQKFAAGQGIKGAANRWTNNVGLFFTSGRTFTTVGNYPVGQNPIHGPFAPGNSGYMGFKVRNGVANNFYYGWMKLKFTVDSEGRPLTIQLVPNGNGVYGAFNSVAGGEILAGQYTAVPEPASVAGGLALFALGAVGVREYRRRRQLAA
jgi:hypothetical protein